jgi:hypothetical protein
MKRTVLFLAIGLMAAGPAWAQEAASAGGAACQQVEVQGSPDSCGQCGCRCGCEKYCQQVCEMVEVKKIVWEVKCSEFCTMLPRLGCGCKCEGECRCGKYLAATDPCALERAKTYIPPMCGCMKTKKELSPREVICKVPQYKCVVVYCCPQCSNAQSPSPPAAPVAAPPPSAPLPPPPPPAKAPKSAPPTP